MNCYRRRVIKREKCEGAYLDYLFDEYVKTDDIAPFNYWKKLKFDQLAKEPKELKNVEPDVVVSIKRYRIYRARGDPDHCHGSNSQ